MDQLQRAEAPQHAAPGGTLTEAAVPIAERSIISGDNVQFGRLRHRVRLSKSESQSSAAEDEYMSTFTEASLSPDQSVRAERTRHKRSNCEHLTSKSNEQLSASPRSPTSGGFLAFQSRPTHSAPIAAVRSSSTPHRRYSRGRNRASSESEKKGRGSKEPVQRKRVLSETEPGPKWDNTKMSGLQCLTAEKIWFDKRCYDEAERRFYEGVNGPSRQHQQDTDASAFLQDIAQSRQNIQESLNGVKAALQQAKGHHQKRRHRNSSSNAAGEQEMISRMKSLELENQTLHKVVGEMRAALQKLESRVAVLEKSPAPAAVPSAKAAPVKQANGDEEEEEDDDDVDLFGSDDDDDEAARLKQERLDAYAAKKAKKPALIAKSSILLDVKPWDDETDMVKLEECVRSVQMDGLLWGASKLVPVGYGIKKLQINCVVEDDKVGTDILEEEITKFEDFVQSVDVAAFNKI